METCDHCKESLEFYNNINRYFYIKPFYTLLGIIFGYRMARSFQCNFSRYLHYLRHYSSKRMQAGYHMLDKSKYQDIDKSVKRMKNLEDSVNKYKSMFCWTLRVCIFNYLTF